MAEVNMDLTKASDDDLLTIKNEVIKRLAERARSGLVFADYDRHGSGHSRSTPPKSIVEPAISPVGRP